MTNTTVRAPLSALPRDENLRYAVLLLPTLFAYTAILKWTYEFKISPVYYYLGEQYREPPAGHYAVSFAILYLVGLFLPRRLSGVSQFTLWILYVLMIVPLMLVPLYADIAPVGTAFNISMISAGTFLFILALVKVLPKDLVPVLPMREEVFWIIIIAITTCSYLYIFSVTHFQIASLDLTKVYNIRDNYRDTIVSSGPLLGYIVRLQGNVINPFLITRGLTGGRKVNLLVGIAGQFVIYSVTGYKLTILSVIATFLIVVYLRNRERASSLVLGAGAAVLVLIAVAVDVARNTSTFAAIFVDRFILVSGNLPSAYFQVFGSQPRVEWRDSFLSVLGASPLATNPAYTVGNYLTGNSHVFANSNYVADGYVNLGVLGIVIEAAVAAVLISVSSSAARRLPLAMSAGVLFTPIVALVNSSPITAILSNGFALSVLLFVFAPRSLWSLRQEIPVEASDEQDALDHEVEALAKPV
ncbi:hypothetical protein [Allobranchiibius sp. CTAmp26]|uniref:hypothetical protein n=1 Tax=Allobranchiibius sp. CTAmp26 TaxID=2815214 RepID=UPI001AA14DF1|nr:hypothetical protein [Allobranchiibius sp. CTAmp26]MBO1755766.1 hypothetical protein [Allobranchiibius sp. CTAmp26]